MYFKKYLRKFDCWSDDICYVESGDISCSEGRGYKHFFGTSYKLTFFTRCRYSFLMVSFPTPWNQQNQRQYLTRHFADPLALTYHGTLSFKMFVDRALHSSSPATLKNLLIHISAFMFLLTIAF